MRLPIPGTSAGAAAGFSALLRLGPDEGRWAYNSLLTVAASVRTRTHPPSVSPRRLTLLYKCREWPYDGTMKAVRYTGLGGAHVLMLLGRRSYTWRVVETTESTTHPPRCHGAREHLPHGHNKSNHLLQEYGARGHLLHGLGSRNYLLRDHDHQEHLPQGHGQWEYFLGGHRARVRLAHSRVARGSLPHAA